MDRKWLLENFPPQKQLLHLGAEFHSISKYFTAFKKFEMSHKLYRAKNLERPSFCILHTRLSWIPKMSSDDAKKYATEVSYLKKKKIAFCERFPQNSL